MSTRPAARTYNQDHIPRKYTPGKRRISIYWTWSYPWEAQRDPAAMENRFSTMTEVRNVLWPAYETPEWSAAQFLQGIAGTLELFHRSTLSFQQIAGEVTGHPVAVFQRIDQAGYKLPIDERILADTDTLMVFGLDHILSEQEAAPEEIAAIREWLKREGTCLLLAPHHDVGFTSDLKQRQMEYLHHGDALVPRQQRFGQYTRSLMKALDVPVHNTYGLRPALVKGTNEIAPLTAFRDIDKLGLLKNVPTLNFHPHLPHYELTAKDARSIQFLARQPIDPDRPHPFTEAGNTEFNCLLWMPPNEQRAGDIVLVDFDEFHHALRRHRKPGELLAESRLDEVIAALPRLPIGVQEILMLMDLLSKASNVAMLSFVVSSMLAMGLGLRIGQIVQPLRNVWLVAFGLVANFILMPLGAFVLAWVLGLDEQFGIGLLVLGCAAGAPFLPKLAELSKGNLPFAVGMMVLLMVVTVAYLPIVLPLLLQGVTVNPMQIVQSLVILMLLPLGVALFVRARFEAMAAHVKPWLDWLSNISLILLIGLITVANIDKVMQVFGTRGILGRTAFHCVWLLCRLAPRWAAERHQARAGTRNCSTQYRGRSRRCKPKL